MSGGRPRKDNAGSERRGRDNTSGSLATPLLDARAASQLLGVPPTWLLAQARARKVPHHRLGHYVRFSAEDLTRWLEETKVAELR